MTIKSNVHLRNNSVMSVPSCTLRNNNNKWPTNKTTKKQVVEEVRIVGAYFAVAFEWH